MDTIFFGFTALSLILLGIGLIKPHWVLPLSVHGAQNQKEKAAIIYFVVFLTCLGIASKLSYQ